MKPFVIFIGVVVLCSSYLIYHAFSERRIATDNLISVLNTAGIDGIENGARIRAHITSVWGNRVTNIIIMPDHVRIIATDGTREWRP